MSDCFSSIVFFFAETWSGSSSGNCSAVRTDKAAGEEVQQRHWFQQAVVAARPGDSLHHALLLEAGDPLHGPGS